jgi:hypothetical protein
MPGVSFQSRADAVGHPVQPLSPVGRADARSAQIGSPAGISQSFQVKANSGEPFTSILARNLLSKHRCRSPLGDEIVKSGPKVALVGVSLSLASARKRLTRTGAGPDSGNAFESGPPQGKRPSSDPGEEMALVESGKVTPALDAALSDRYRYPAAAYKTVHIADAVPLIPELPKAPCTAHVLRVALPGILTFHEKVAFTPAADCSRCAQVREPTTRKNASWIFRCSQMIPVSPQNTSRWPRSRRTGRSRQPPAGRALMPSPQRPAGPGAACTGTARH